LPGNDRAKSIDNLNKVKRPERRALFSKAAILAATFVGGPLVTGILVASNLYQFNKKAKALRAIIAGFLGSLILFLAIFLIPQTARNGFVYMIIPFIYTTVVFIFLEFFHQDELVQHKQEGGYFRRFGQAALYGISGLVFSMVVILLHFSANQDVLIPHRIGNNDYFIMHSETIPTEDLQKLETFLKDQEYFTESQNRAAFLELKGEYEVRLIQDESLWHDPDTQIDLRIFELLLNQTGFRKKIHLKITDTTLVQSMDIN